VHVELAEDAASVRAHGIGGDHQVRGDLVARLALRHADHHVELARAERTEQVAALGGSPDIAAQLAQDLAEHARREPGVAVGHPAQHGLELIGRLLLGDPGIGACPGGIDRVRDVPVRADDDHARGRPRGPQPVQDLRHGGAQRLDLDQDDIRAQPPDNIRQPRVVGAAAARNPQVRRR
jgi:hypothetical protein